MLRAKINTHAKKPEIYNERRDAYAEEIRGRQHRTRLGVRRHVQDCCRQNTPYLQRAIQSQHVLDNGRLKNYLEKRYNLRSRSHYDQRILCIAQQCVIEVDTLQITKDTMKRGVMVCSLAHGNTMNIKNNVRTTHTATQPNSARRLSRLCLLQRGRLGAHLSAARVHGQATIGHDTCQTPAYAPRASAS